MHDAQPVIMYGGEDGIRTHDRDILPVRAFQARALGRTMLPLRIFSHYSGAGRSVNIQSRILWAFGYTAIAGRWI